MVILLFLGSQQDHVLIDAEQQTGSKTDHIEHASGNVVVTYRDMRLEADEVTYDDETNMVTAGNHVVYSRADEHLQADRISLNVTSKVGDFTNVTGQIGPGFNIKAESAHRTEEGLYQLKNATITTCCDGPRPGWMLFVARAVIDPHRRDDGERFGFPPGKRAGVLHAVHHSSQRGQRALDRFPDPLDVHLDDERTSRPRVLLLGDEPQRRRRIHRRVFQCTRARRID